VALLGVVSPPVQFVVLYVADSCAAVKEHGSTVVVAPEESTQLASVQWKFLMCDVSEL
jgi:hypothetical protein